jgi:hypothetical protein
MTVQQRQCTRLKTDCPKVFAGLYDLFHNYRIVLTLSASHLICLQLLIQGGAHGNQALQTPRKQGWSLMATLTVTIIREVPAHALKMRTNHGWPLTWDNHQLAKS